MESASCSSNHDCGVFGEGINEFLNMMPNYQSGKVSIRRLPEFLNKQDHRLEGRDDLEFDRNADVVHEHLTFGYDDKNIGGYIL